MKLLFLEDAWDDYLFWQKTDHKKHKKINALIKECLRDPFHGTGKPEPLKFDLNGYWSRRIDGEHRLAYICDGESVTIVQCRYHY